MNKEHLEALKKIPYFKVVENKDRRVVLEEAVMTDEYKTPLFVGDRYWWVNSSVKPLKCISNDICVIAAETSQCSFWDGVKIFATKESAEKWIEDAEKKQSKEAVNVCSQAEWDFVSKRLGYVWKTNTYDLFGTTSCIYLHKKLSANTDYYKRNDYKILSFDEWCKREGINNPFEKPKCTPKGQIEVFPHEVIKKMLKRQKQQVGKKDITVFEERCGAEARFGGFTWRDTAEGHDFWRNVIQFKRFDIFFERYPKNPKYTPNGQLKGFPSEVIKKMLKRQKQQTGKKDVSVFERFACANIGAGGFDWDVTKEKYNFWNDVICFKRFDKFFERYPKKQK